MRYNTSEFENYDLSLIKSYLESILLINSELGIAEAFGIKDTLRELIEILKERKFDMVLDNFIHLSIPSVGYHDNPYKKVKYAFRDVLSNIRTLENNISTHRLSVCETKGEKYEWNNNEINKKLFKDVIQGIDLFVANNIPDGMFAKFIGVVDDVDYENKTLIKTSRTQVDFVDCSDFNNMKCKSYGLDDCGNVWSSTTGISMPDAEEFPQMAMFYPEELI